MNGRFKGGEAFGPCDREKIKLLISICKESAYKQPAYKLDWRRRPGQRGSAGSGPSEEILSLCFCMC